LDQKRLLIAAVLSLVVLFGWQALFPPVKPELTDDSPPQEIGERGGADLQSPASDTGKNEQDRQSITGPSDPEPRSNEGEFDGDGAETEQQLAVEPAFTARSGDREQTTVIDTGSYRAEFTNRGAVLQHYTVLDRLETGGGELDIVRRREGGLMPFGLIDSSGVPLDSNDQLFAVEKGTDSVRMVFADANQRIEKRWQLESDGQLLFSLTVEGVEGWGWQLGPGLRNPPPGEATSRLMRRSAIYRAAGKVETEVAGAKAEAFSLAAESSPWFGLSDNYFLAVAIPDKPSGVVRFVPFRSTAEVGGIGTWVPPGPVYDSVAPASTEWGAWVYPESESWGGKLYMGAKKLKNLKAIAPGLDDSVHTGMLRILARPLHVALLWIHDHMVANYGWSIVLLTLLMRILLFPLTHKSAVSMRKMQALNPQIQSIRARYRPKLKDKQGRPNVEMQRKMNEEVMGLYKAEGANPAGGCLPMLLQMPVFIAFYTMLPAAVELRNAPWMLWIKDLSIPDPLYALPIIMGASQLIMQRLMPSTGDKAQQRIMLIMPIVFTFLFLKFAAGLVLYWLTSNLLGIGQQLVTNKILGPPLSSQPQNPAKKPA